MRKQALKKGFYILSESWYGDANLENSDYNDEILIHLGDEEDFQGEFNIKWTTLDNRSVPILEVFDDAWHAFAMMPELLALLDTENDMCISPESLAKRLKEIGFEDWTVRENPNPLPVKLTSQEQIEKLVEFVNQVANRGYGAQIDIDRAKELQGEIK